MNHDHQESPPSYSEIVGNPVQHFSNDRAAAYAVPPTQNVGYVKYTAFNELVPNTYGEQIFPIRKLGGKAIQCTCANCHSPIITQVKRTPGMLVWILCCILILFGCWLGCCLLPFCIPEIQNAQHYCPNCNSFIGEYRPL